MAHEFHQLHRFLEHKAYKLRVASLKMTSHAGSGHPTSCLSAADLVAALFFYAMKYDPDQFDNPNNDRFILSKGHAAPLLYAAWKELEKISEDELLTYRSFSSPLEGHPTARFAYAEAATGSLGMGLSIGAGMALAGRMDHRSFYTYVLMGDSEITEGSIWEAAEIAGFYKLNTLIGIIDCNRLGQSTETMHGYHVQRYAHKFEAFGWKTIVIDGHDMSQITHALDKARASVDLPVMIIAKTIKGYGIKKAEDQMGFHGISFKKEELTHYVNELEHRFAQAAMYTTNQNYSITKPEQSHTTGQHVQQSLKAPVYKNDELIATRKAYGQALTIIASNNKDIVSLDAEVKNSTFAYLFEEKFPERFIQCFVAEQNMISMAVGMHKRGKIPFVSTFGAFFCRAFDQIRMAAIGKSALRLIGSHAGVSIGQDGPSQMALEDLALMQAVPDSIVLYPCDAPSTYQLVSAMATYENGISYLRTTRMETPVIYNDTQLCTIGGSTVLQQSPQDIACIVAAGITVHEALKAYELLKKQNVFVSVIDAYSIKPLDLKTISTIALQSKNTIITVEDHYIYGGLGQAVSNGLRNECLQIICLAVTKLPHSGTPKELLQWAEIDAGAIIKVVQTII